MQLLKQYKYSKKEAQKNNVKFKELDIIVGLLMTTLLIGSFMAFRIFVLNKIDDSSILIVAGAFMAFAVLFLLLRKSICKEDLLQFDLYIKTDEGYYIVETANLLKTVFPHSFRYETYETRVQKELKNSSADFIIRALKPGCDVKHLYKRGIFYQIIKAQEVEEKDSYYILKADCIKNGKRKINNKRFKMFKAYEEIEEFISSIREL